MTPLPAAAQTYLRKRRLPGPWQLLGGTDKGCQGAVVIPSLAEGDNLIATLESLARALPAPGSRWLVVVIVNHCVTADRAVREQNRHDLDALVQIAARPRDLPFELAWVDAASPGQELPAKKGGVGMARKIGLDLVLERLAWEGRPVLACLDADTLVEPNYLERLAQHFQTSGAGAAVLPFRHQAAGESRRQDAIERYELFLRGYAFGLAQAGSPYAFIPVGSAMACTATAYVQVGGMNCRKAAEDFHFLAKLAKTVGVAHLHGTRVYPQARSSDRVPFGTGRSIARQLAGDAEAVRYYPQPPFAILGRWLSLVAGSSEADAADLLSRAETIDPGLSHFLHGENWLAVWPRLQAHHAPGADRQRAFHTWFDALRTLRLIHALCEAGHVRSSDERILLDLIRLAGFEPPRQRKDLLNWFRCHAA